LREQRKKKILWRNIKKVNNVSKYKKQSKAVDDLIKNFYADEERTVLPGGFLKLH